jgi:hypothetical protein
MCFGGGSDDSSKKMVAMQEQEAAAARSKELDRQTRINQGIANIKAAFHGGNMMGTRQVQGPATTSTQRVQGAPTSKRVWVESHNGGGHWDYQKVPGQWTTSTTTNPGAMTNEDYVTGTSGGFGDDFYNKYKGAITDYYQPQVAEKYGDAKDELTYRLARAGTLRSSVASDEAADLSGQYDRNTAKIIADADTATGELKNRVAKEEQNAMNTLYATENPEVAANQATAALTNISAEKPDLSPLGEIFDIAAIGGANFLKGANNAYYTGQANQAGTAPKYGATKIV